MNILIVDDSPSICLFLTHALELESHVVCSAGSAEEAIIYLLDHSPDLIIMDVELPGMNGFEATEQIRSNKDNIWFPILYLSSHTEESAIERGIDAGGDAYLTKPIKLVELKSKIKALERIANVHGELTRTNELLRSVLSSATDGIFTVDSNGIIRSINDSGCAILRLSPEQAIGQNIETFLTDANNKPKIDRDFSAAEQLIGTQLDQCREMEFRRMSGETFPVEVSVNSVADNGSNIYIGIFRDISNRKARENELHKARIKLQAMNDTLMALSYRDGLTGIHNRRAFDEAILRELHLAQRNSTELSLVMCDIDHFKNFNDSYGHQMGDKALITVARTIQESTQRPADLVARYGGEEFVILLPQTDAAGARLIAEKSRNAVCGLEIPNAGSPSHQYVTLSMGVTTLQPSANCSVENLIQMADDALYDAKKMGRNNVQTLEHS